MKIDRLIGILSVLLQREQVTAFELAEKFEVSHRTILRDMDALCCAGIPIVTEKGRNGGIRIMEGYKLDKTVLLQSEMQAISCRAAKSGQHQRHASLSTADGETLCIDRQDDSGRASGFD